MFYERYSSTIEGSIESPNLTLGQKKYIDFLTALNKAANIIALRNGTFMVEQPDGYQKMMDQIKKDGKNYDKLTAKEIERYEKEFRYQKVSNQKLGNGGVILQHLLIESHHDKVVATLLKEFIDDCKSIANKTTTEYADRRNRNIDQFKEESTSQVT